MKINLNHIFLIFLPFTQALTLNIFFPLKISEIILVAIFFTFLNKKVISSRSIWFANKNYLLVFFSIIVTLSFLVNIYWSYPYPPKPIDFRINRVGDSFIRLCYFYLCIFSYFVSFGFLTRRIKILDKWVLGAIIAAVYGWYLFLSSGLRIPYLLLPGMDENPQQLSGFIRCSTFKEGNYFGLFLILSASIAFYLKQRKKAWFLLLSIVVTMSTISIISGVIFVAYYYRKSIFQTVYFFRIVPVFILCSFLFAQTDFYKMYVYGKLFDATKKLTQANFSKVDRIITGRIAYLSGLDNPVLGVGPSNYALHYDRYNDYKSIVKRRNVYFDDFIKRKNIRSIPNNVYLEILSEYGVSGLLLFVSFLLSLLYKSYLLKEDAITGGMISLIISINAFPSFIMLFLWAYFAVPYALEWIKRERDGEISFNTD